MFRLQLLSSIARLGKSQTLSEPHHHLNKAPTMQCFATSSPTMCDSQHQQDHIPPQFNDESSHHAVSQAIRCGLDHIDNTFLMMEKRLVNELNKINRDQAELAKAKREWEAEQALVRQRCGNPSDVLVLNIGGTQFTTLRSTLMKYRGTLLSLAFSGCHMMPTDPQGRLFLDRDPTWFKAILNWLRTDTLPTIPTNEQKKEFWVELDFYGLTEAFLAHPQGPQVFNSSNSKTALQNFDLKLHSPSFEGSPGNTPSHMQTESFAYGACARGSPAIVEAKFEENVLLSGVKVAPFFCAPWSPTDGAGASIEYFDGREWKKVASIPTDFGRGCPAVYVLDWKPQFASKWRFVHPSAIGLSRLVFF